MEIQQTNQTAPVLSPNKWYKRKNIAIMTILVVVAIGAVSVFLYLTKVTTLIKCEDSLARKYVIQNGLFPVQSCEVESFDVNNSKVKLVQVAYGEAQDCPSGCFYEGKNALFEESGEKIADLKHMGFPLLLPQDDYGLACNYVWKSSVDSVLSEDPQHVKRSLIKIGNEYKWRFELNNFTGFSPDVSSTYPDYHPNFGFTCARTGIFTTDLNGENPVAEYEPIIRIVDFGTCEDAGFQMDFCCEDFKIAKKLDPRYSNMVSPVCN